MGLIWTDYTLIARPTTGGLGPFRGLFAPFGSMLTLRTAFKIMFDIASGLIPNPN
jgi:hypothetical protein